MGDFTFTTGGETFTLPPAASVAQDIPGGVTLDAIVNPEDVGAQVRLTMAALSAAAAPAAMAALRAMTTADMMQVTAAWMSHVNDDGEATLPES